MTEHQAPQATGPVDLDEAQRLCDTATPGPSLPRIRTLEQLIDQRVDIALLSGSSVWGRLVTYSWGDQEIPTMLVVQTDSDNDLYCGETLFVPWQAIAYFGRSRIQPGGGS